MTYRHTCPTPCTNPDCAEQHPDGNVCHDRHRFPWHRTHNPDACEQLLAGNDLEEGAA